MTMTAQAQTSTPRRTSLLGTISPYLLIAPPILLMLCLIFLPALQSVIRTLMVDPDAGDATFTLSRYIEFFQNPVSQMNLWFTVWVTGVVVGLLFIVCFPLAIYLRFATSRIAGWVQVLALFPLFVPGIVLAFALIRFVGPRGTIDTLLNLIGITGYRSPYLKPTGIILGLAWEGIPFTVLVLTAGLRQIDNALIESARDVGANNWQIFRHILLPLLRRPALIVLSLNFLGVFGAFTIPYLLGPASPMMMGVYMQQTFNGYLDRNGAETQAMITFLCCALVGLLYVRAVTSQRGER